MPYHFLRGKFSCNPQVLYSLLYFRVSENALNKVQVKACEIQIRCAGAPSRVCGHKLPLLTVLTRAFGLTSSLSCIFYPLSYSRQLA